MRELSATKERLDSISTTVAACTTHDVEFLGERLVYESEQLKIQREFASKEAVVTHVTGLMQELLSGTVSALTARFSYFESHEAGNVFSPSTWPSDSALLPQFAI